MKKILTLSAVSVASLFFLEPTFAVYGGFYVGAGAGYGILRTPTSVFQNQTSHQRGGLSGRVFTGFNFNKFFGVEAGYAQYALSRNTASMNGFNSSVRYYTRTADAVLKGYLPIGLTAFNLYALAGAASYREQIKYGNAGNALVSNFAAPPLGSSTIRKTRPIYGIGLNYDSYGQVSLNLEVTRIQKLGSFTTNANAIPYADLSTFNVIYNFG